MPHVPQLVTSCCKSTQVLPHADRLAAQDHPHAYAPASVAVHASVALAGAPVHGEHELPHVAGLVSSAHVVPPSDPH